jgi:hypothetical protein
VGTGQSLGEGPGDEADYFLNVKGVFFKVTLKNIIKKNQRWKGAVARRWICHWNESHKLDYIV